MKFIFLLSFSMVFALSAREMMIIGHRGAPGYEPENSLSSFQKAIELGVGMIEFDVHLCATGELVVIHDETVDRTTNGHGNVVDMSFDQLRHLVVGGKEKIPTLEEVIELLGRRVPLNIELKGLGTAIPVAQILQKYLQRGWVPADFIVSSFDHEQIGIFHQLLPTVKTGVLFSTTMKNKLRQYLSNILPSNVLNYFFRYQYEQMVHVAQQHKAYFIGVEAGLMNAEMVRVAHQAGLLIFAWTVNDTKIAGSLRAMSVDAIFSNYPDRVSM